MAVTSEKMEETAKRLDNAAKTADAVVAETRLHFDTLVQLQMDERQQCEERHAKEKQEIRSHYAKIIFGLIITLFILIGGIFGTVVYLFMNYDFATSVTYQDVYSDNHGNSEINDGINYNKYGAK